MQRKLECPGYRNLGCTDRHRHAPKVAWARMILRFDSVGTNLVFKTGMPGMPIFCESWISCLACRFWSCVGCEILGLCKVCRRLESCPSGEVGCLPSTQISGKSGWKVNGTRLFGLFQRKPSGSSETSEKGSHVFSGRNFPMEIRVPLLQSHL